VTPLPARVLVVLLMLAPLGCAELPWSTAERKAAAATLAQGASPSMAEQWAAAFSRGDLEAIVGLYDEEALLWGTSSSTLRRGASAIRQYYAQLLEAFPGTKIALGETSPRLYGNAGVDSGSYTVRLVAGDGKARVTLARFTMTYVKRNGKWLIVDHHSSLATH
jgi:uncharacterized protein (TIGR02246 family)